MYDARKGGASSETEAKSWVFGLIALMVAAVVFVGVWKGPDLLNGGGGGGGAPAMSAERAVLAPVFADRREQDVILKMAKVDPAGYQRFLATFERGDSPDQIRESYRDWSQMFILENIELLAVMDVKYLNQFLDLTVETLGDMEASGSRYCQMSFYANLERRGEQAAMMEAGRIAAAAQTPGNPLFEYAMSANTIILDGMIEARSKPMEYGELDNSDMIKLRNSMMRLALAPEFQMMMKSGGPRPADVEKLNACAVGRKLIVTFDSVSDRTKGRLWQTALRQNGDLSALASLR